MSPLAKVSRGVAAAVLLVGNVMLTGCTPAPTPTTSTAEAPAGNSSPEAAPATSSGASSTPATSSDAVTIKITIADGNVNPNGQRIDIARGQTVVLEVTSDGDDEVHAHLPGDELEFEVPAGVPTTGRLVASQRGRFEVESHHLEKIILVVNVH
ncbi:MAG TPA: hypothetical protein VFJ97_10790 [Dermatophilaceae bacterium]|nr:hypothetical protein [Dermatophilaceae bacterium]